MKNNFINQAKNKYQIVCSTDVVGFLGNPMNAYKFWRSIIPSDITFGLEVISFYHHVPLLTKIPNIIGYHVRCDSSYIPRNLDIPMWIVNYLMATPQDILRLIDSKKDFYINSHNLYVSQMKKIIFPENIYMFCENDNEPNSYKQSLELGRAYDGTIFDIVHYCVEKKGKIGWEVAIDEAIEKIYEIGQCLVHISWGWNKKDALPEDISDGTLKKISKAIEDTSSMPVLEFQWGNKDGSIGCDPTKDPQKVKNAQMKIQKLIETEIIKKTE